MTDDAPQSESREADDPTLTVQRARIAYLALALIAAALFLDAAYPHWVPAASIVTTLGLIVISMLVGGPVVSHLSGTGGDDR